MKRTTLIAGAAALVLVAGVGYVAAQQIADRKVAEQADRILNDIRSYLPPGVELTHGGAEADLLSREAVVKDIRLQGAGTPMRASEFRLHSLEMDGESPSRLDYTLKGVEVLVSDLPPGPRETLSRLGYDRIEADVRNAFTYQQKGGTLDVSTLRVEAPQMGTLDLTAQVENVPNTAPANPMMAMIMVLPLVIEGGVLTYRDDSLVERLVREGARREGVTEPVYRERLIGNLERTLSRAGSPFERETLAALQRFLANPEALTVRVAPEQPVQLFRLMNVREPGEVQKLLGLSVAAQ